MDIKLYYLIEVVFEKNYAFLPYTEPPVPHLPFFSTLYI